MISLQSIFNICCLIAILFYFANSPTIAAQQQKADLRTDPSLQKALSLQFHLEDLDIEKQAKIAKLQDQYRTYISKSIFERNEFLRKVPSFWYYALRSTPNSEKFMSPIHHHSHFHSASSSSSKNKNNQQQPSSSSSSSSSSNSYCGVGGSDQCVSHDHDMLKMFLRSVRCHKVTSTPETADSLGWTSHQQTLKKQVAVDGVKGLAKDAIPIDTTSTSTTTDDHDSSSSPSLFPTSSSSDGELRIELEFESNNIFQERKIFRQVPIHYRREMFAAEVDDNMKEHGAIRAYFGLGTTLKWIGGKKGRETLLYGADEENRRIFAGHHQQNNKNKKKNASSIPRMVSFFSLFDHETLAEVSTNPELESFRKVLQQGLGSLVNSVCGQLDHNPIPFYESEFGEESLAALLHQQQNSKHLNKFAQSEQGEEEDKNGNENENSSEERGFVDELLASVHSNIVEEEMTEAEKELVRVMRGDL